ncbi:hypothetical protein ACFL27_00590 [candidate division CSSED10-310 bacterium]|uniref:Uncharacterized protein n=1 Tax=candidate division CSSED10-310 bacterium TaxID=2855610 RepID=A0ABV6YR61_UNCC1
MKHPTISIIIISIILIGFGSACKNLDEDELSDMEKIIARNTAALVAVIFVAADANQDYDEDEGTTYKSGAACPDVNWYGVCQWTIDYGAGCYGPLGNYFSGSFSTNDCETWTFSDLCINNRCTDGTMTFTVDTGCAATYCWEVDIDLTFSDDNDTVDLIYQVTTGVNETSWYMYAPSTMSLASQNYGSYSATVVQDLFKSPGCVHPTRGMINLVLNQDTTLTIDYDTGRCNTVFVNGYEIYLQ